MKSCARYWCNKDSHCKMSILPYGRQCIDEDDIQAVNEVLRSDFLTTGPTVPAFEKTVARFCGAKEGVAVSSGTAALHAAMAAFDVGPGDEVLVPAMTFAATANCVLYTGATPVFVDVCRETMLIDPTDVRRRFTSRTKGVVGVDYAGQPCDWNALREVVDGRDAFLLADACHSIGGAVSEGTVGTLADATVFSFHPVKQVATGEGGMVVTDEPAIAESVRRFRNHGISTELRQREKAATWYYEMVELGFNYRMTDIQAALGISQMRKLSGFLERRAAIAKQYDAAFAGSPVSPLEMRTDVNSAWHLYVVRVPHRDEVFSYLRSVGIGVQVHYIPVHLHPYYRKQMGVGPGLCPVAEQAYEEILSLPLFPAMKDDDVSRVVDEVMKAVEG